MADAISRQERRERREAKALAVLKAMKDSKQAEKLRWTTYQLGSETQNEMVYFLYSAGLIKIGYTSNIYRRFADLKNMGGATATLVAVVPYVHKDYEKLLHQLFKADRSHGEWFRPSAEIKRFLECIDDAAKLTMPPEVLPKIGSCVGRLEAAVSGAA